ncbi:hypothetical protein [Paraburkholderia youngii]|uniref:hypothetical protein n=1 Tax=Paraburkholderia youngii TaxID=2782701 RepID=UPI003D1B01EA
MNQKEIEQVSVSKFTTIRYYERVPAAAASICDGTHCYAYGRHVLRHLPDGRRTVEVTDNAILRRVSFEKNGEAYLEVGRAGSAIAVTAGLPFAVTAERFDGATGDVVVSLEMPSGKLPVGTRKANFGTNHPGTPERDGQIGVFVSPYSHSSWLVDVAERDSGGALRWVALPFEDPRYEKAILEARALAADGVTRHTTPLTSRMLAGQYPVKGSMPLPVVKQLYQLREAEVAVLSRQSVITEADIRQLDRGARGMVADLLLAKCDEAARHALLHDEHPHVRSIAAGALADLVAKRKGSVEAQAA